MDGAVPRPEGLKRLAKGWLEEESRYFPSLARELLFLRQARRDARLVSKVGLAANLPTLDTSQSLIGNKPKSTIFILAGGASINGLSSMQWEEISKAASIGINAWPIHRFIPDVLSIETTNTPGPPSETALFLSERIDSHVDSGGQIPHFFLLRPAWPPNNNRVYPLLTKNRNTTYVYGRANIMTRRKNNLEADLRRIIQRAVAGALPSKVLPDNGSSVVRTTFWALIQGYRRIVWLGVDQNSGPYFWTEEPIAPEYRKAANLFPRKSGEPHSTSNSENRPFSNEVFLENLSRAVSQATKSRIFVGSPNSQLSESIPRFSWE